MISVEFLLTSLVVVLILGNGVLYNVATEVFVGKRASLFAPLGCTFGTASLTIDCAGSARVEAWIEIKTDLQKVGRKVAFANGYFIVNKIRIARASDVLAVAK